MQSTSIANRQRAAYLWLVYLAFFFIEPIFKHQLEVWVKSLVAVAIFLVIFAAYVRTGSKRVRFAMIVATFALGMVCLPWNGGASVFFIYAASFLPFSIESVPLVMTLFGVEALGAAAEGRWLHASWGNVAMAIFLLLVIGTGNIFFAQQKRADCKLRAALEENVALAAVAERERIARDLHDVLGHTLSLIVLKAELAGRLLERDPLHGAARAASEIAEVESTARTALAEVREAIGGYRSRGLVAEIEAARRTLDAAGITLQCDAMPTTMAALRANEETVLALALREAITNIVRHSKATVCTLRFEVEGNQHRLLIADNGGETERAELREGNGLRGMRERVEALGGRLSLERDGGTRLLIALPLQAVEGA